MFKLLATFVFDRGKYNLNETGSEKAEIKNVIALQYTPLGDLNSTVPLRENEAYLKRRSVLVDHAEPVFSVLSNMEVLKTYMFRIEKKLVSLEK